MQDVQKNNDLMFQTSEDYSYLIFEKWGISFGMQRAQVK